MSEIIKEYCKQEKGHRFILRLPHYGHSLYQIMSLYQEAGKDFGTLDSQKVDVVQYGGKVYKRTFGIEFNSMVEPPEGYKQVEQVEALR